MFFFILMLVLYIVRAGPCNKEYQFRCNNTRCVNATQVCDQTDNCGDLSDEANCREWLFFYVVLLDVTSVMRLTLKHALARVFVVLELPAGRNSGATFNFYAHLSCAQQHSGVAHLCHTCFTCLFIRILVSSIISDRAIRPIMMILGS